MIKAHLALLYGLATVLIWSTVPTAFKLALLSLDPYQLMLVASLTAFAVLLAVLGLQGRCGELRDIKAAEIKKSLLLGFFNPVLYYILLFKGFAILPAQVAQPVNYTWVITLTLLSVPVLGRKLSPRDAAGLVIGYLGLLVIATGGRPALPEAGQLSGLLCILAGTVIWAAYWLIGVKRSLSPVTALTLNFACAIPWSLAATLLFSEPPLKPELWSGLLAGAYVGAFEMGLAFVTWLYALKLSPSTARLASLVYLAPFLSLLWVSLVLEEKIAPASVVGLSLIVAGSLLQSVKQRKK